MANSNGTTDVKEPAEQKDQTLPVITEPSETESDDKRVRKHTIKAQENYVDTVQKYLTKLSCLQRNVDYEIETFKAETNHKVDSISVCRKRIENSLTIFLNLAKEFTAFLTRQNTAESLQELEKHRFKCTILENFVDETYREMRKLKENIAEKESIKSRTTKRSSRTGSTSSTVKMKAKAVAAKASLEFAEKESKLKKLEAEMQLKKMTIQADLELLDKQRQAAVATAEYKATVEDDSSQELDSVKDIPKENSYERTKRYVENQNNAFKDPVEYLQAEPSFGAIASTLHITPQNQEGTTQQNQYSVDNQNNNTLTELSRFLLKKDLLMSRFSRFSDRPEAYALWRSSFKAITRELVVSPTEESELMIKWLGPESTRFAQSIRTSNIDNPSVGLQKIWQRLEDRFGNPEMVETSLKSKLADFLQVVLKDKKRLYDLQDIL